MVALDLTDITDTGSVVRESQYSVKKTLSKTQPASPTLLLVTPDLATLKPKLNWSHPNTGAVSFYRIYRTPSTVSTCCATADRWAVTANGTTTSFVDSTAPSGTYNYWVTAVGPGLNESTPVGPVGGVAP